MNHGLKETRTGREDKLRSKREQERGEESRTHLSRNLSAHLVNRDLEQRLRGPARAGRRLRCGDS